MKKNKEHKIASLIERYQNAEATRVEEEQLKDLMQLEENKKQYPEIAALFSYQKRLKKEVEHQPKIADFINQITEEESKKTPFSSRFISFYKYASILIIALSALFFVAQYQNDLAKKEEARTAYLQTKKALLTISAEMNNATQNLSKIEDFTQKTQKFINP